MINSERLDGIIKKGIEFYSKSPIPSIVEVSVSDTCNLRCAFCPKSHADYPNNPLLIDDKVVERLSSELKRINFTGLVVLSGYGEPLIHPTIHKIVEKLSKVALVDVVTNGTLLTERILSKLILCGVNKILASAYSKQMHQRLERIFAELPYDRYEIRPRYQDFKTTNRGGCLGGRGYGSPCYYLAYNLMLDWNGDVMLCPQDFNRKVRFGNIMTSPIETIWDSDYMNSYRMQLFETRNNLQPCKRCDVNGCVHGKEHMGLWKVCKS